MVNTSALIVVLCMQRGNMFSLILDLELAQNWKVGRGLENSENQNDVSDTLNYQAFEKHEVQRNILSEETDKQTKSKQFPFGWGWIH